jgi:hypothetical protein
LWQVVSLLPDEVSQSQKLPRHNKIKTQGITTGVYVIKLQFFYIQRARFERIMQTFYTPTKCVKMHKTTLSSNSQAIVLFSKDIQLSINKFFINFHGHYDNFFQQFE